MRTKLICNKHGITDFTKSGIKIEKWRCCKCVTDSAKKYLQSLKLKAVEYKGSKCEICSYDKCLRSLVFHHIDPSQKDFSIGESRPGHKKSRNWELIKIELDKCQLLCQNCHCEIHDEMVKKKHKNNSYNLNLHKKNIHLINTNILKGRNTPEELMERIKSGFYDTTKKLTKKEIRHEAWVQKNLFIN